jgi:hypothetical protein
MSVKYFPIHQNGDWSRINRTVGTPNGETSLRAALTKLTLPEGDWDHGCLIGGGDCVVISGNRGGIYRSLGGPDQALIIRTGTGWNNNDEVGDLAIYARLGRKTNFKTPLTVVLTATNFRGVRPQDFRRINLVDYDNFGESLAGGLSPGKLAHVLWTQLGGNLA